MYGYIPSSFNSHLILRRCQDGSTARAAGAMGGGERCMGSSVSAAGRLSCGLRDLQWICTDLHGAFGCLEKMLTVKPINRLG